MSEPTTAEDIRELARLNHSGIHSCTGVCLAVVVDAFAAAAEAERARIRAAVETMTDYSDEPDSMWVRRAVVLAAIDGPASAELGPDAPGTAPAEPRCDFDCDACRSTPDRAAIDDEAKTPEWRDDSGHWIGGNVGMPEHRPEGNEGYCACGTWVWESRRNPWRCPAAIDDEAKG